jgi:hypothetical protein
MIRIAVLAHGRFGGTLADRICGRLKISRTNSLEKRPAGGAGVGARGLNRETAALQDLGGN